MFGRGARVRVLRPAFYQPALEVALADPVLNALPGSRLVELRSRALHLSQEFMTYGPEAEPEAVLWNGVNIAPMQAGPRALEVFAERLAARPRRAGSLVGPRAGIERLWAQLGRAWGPLRAERWSQPVLEATAPSAVPPEPGVRAARPAEAPLVYPAAVAMFTEEVGVDPTAADGGRAYRSRVEHLIGAHRTYVLIEGQGRDARVVFKADVGALFGDVAQLHGVWVAPDRRGEGLGRRAMAAVTEQVRRDHVDRVSLYVNDFNEPARRAYAAAGFTPVGELATLMF